jgi:hypothetical protein
MDLAFISKLDATDAISLICAAVSASCAIVQVVYARKATSVALQIAADQAAEATRARTEAAEAKREGLRRFVDAVLAVGREALLYTRASVGVGEELRPSSNVPSHWRQTLADFQNALEIMSGAGPPDAELLLAVARMRRALDVLPGLPQGPYPNEQVLRRVRDMLLEEVNRFEYLAMRAGFDTLITI